MSNEYYEFDVEIEEKRRVRYIIKQTDDMKFEINGKKFDDINEAHQEADNMMFRQGTHVVFYNGFKSTEESCIKLSRRHVE